MLGKLPKVESKERPYLNSMYISGPYNGEPRSMNLNTLIYWVKNTPECIGIIKRIATDIVTSFGFVAIEEPIAAGRPKKNYSAKLEDKAKIFARRNFLKQKLLAAVIDWLMTGDGYIWKGRLSNKQVKESIDKHYSLLGIETKEIVTYIKTEFKQFFDEDWNSVNAIEVIPSSMVLIEHDHEVIKKFIQKAKAQPEKNRQWSPSEVIHAKFMEIDGKVYGFSPMEASYTAIKTINAIQDYGYNYFANGVKLDRAWMFSGNVNQNYIDAFEETLKQYKRVRNSHGDLMVAGADKISVEKLNEVSEEMEHRQLAIHAVGRLAFAFNMPADILSSILGVDVKGTAIGSDIEDAGYNRNIEQSQRYWEELLNTQLFAPEFKVEIKLEKTFKQDKIREVQYLVQTAPILEFLFKHEVPVTDEYILNMLNIQRKYLKEGKIKREVEMPMLGQPGQPMQKGPNQEKFAASKAAQQKPQQNITPPSGKERIENKEATYLDNDVFISEVKKWAGNQETLSPRAMKDRDKIYVKFSIPHSIEEIRTVFNSSDWPNDDLKAQSAVFTKEMVENKEITYLNPQTFLDEINRWGINQDSLVRIRMMQKGSKIYFKFAIPHTSEEVRTMIPAKEYNTFDWMNLNQIVVPAMWEEKFNFKSQEKKKRENIMKDETKILVQEFETKPLDDVVTSTFGLDKWEGF